MRLRLRTQEKLMLANFRLKIRNQEREAKDYCKADLKQGVLFFITIFIIITTSKEICFKFINSMFKVSVCRADTAEAEG